MSIDPRIQEVVDRYPREFGLLHFPTDRFRIDPRGSFIDTSKVPCADGQIDEVQVVIQVLRKDGWVDFLRCGAHELRGNVVK